MSKPFTFTAQSVNYHHLKGIKLMKQISKLIVLLLAASSCAFAQAKSTAQKHPVETFFLSGIAAFNAHELDSFMKQFASDIEMYTPTGWLRGQQSVRQRFAQYQMGTGAAFHGVGSGVYILRNGNWVEVLEHETVLKVDEGLNTGRK
jgi:hypothetical protein